jgi:hypothetical protein
MLDPDNTTLILSEGVYAKPANIGSIAKMLDDV